MCTYNNLTEIVVEFVSRSESTFWFILKWFSLECDLFKYLHVFLIYPKYIQDIEIRVPKNFLLCLCYEPFWHTKLYLSLKCHQKHHCALLRNIKGGILPPFVQQIRIISLWSTDETYYKIQRHSNIQWNSNKNNCKDIISKKKSVYLYFKTENYVHLWHYI